MQKLVIKNRKFTNTAIPVFSGTEGWYQHIHIVQAIVKSNGWPEETAALQLFVHLKERVPSTGIGSSYIRNRSRNVGDSRVWRYEGASARYDDKG